MSFNLQPTLETDQVKLIPLRQEDFEKLYYAAADPLIWLQHPNKNRFRKPVFTTFFEGAIASQGAFKIVDKKTNEVIGSTRFYEYDEKNKSVSIGYTFYTVTSWGKGINPEVKKIMIEYALKQVDKIHFHIGAKNKRSQVAIERIGAIKIAEQEMQYHGEDEHLGFIYEITRESWEEFLRKKEDPSVTS